MYIFNIGDTVVVNPASLDKSYRNDPRFAITGVIKNIHTRAFSSDLLYEVSWQEESWASLVNGKFLMLAKILTIEDVL